MPGPFIGAGLRRRRRPAAPGLPVPSALLLSNRLNQMGFGGFAGSDGVDRDSNSRLSFFNQIGATATRLKACFANWMANATNEQNAYNPIAVAAALEYPAGTFAPFSFGGAGVAAIANGALAESDPLAVSIPNGAQYWVRTYVAVGPGEKWPQGYIVNATRGEAADFATGVDRTAGGTIVNASPTAARRAYGPAAVKAVEWSGTIRKIAVASLGDSILMQAGDGNFDSIGSGGWNGRAMSGRCPHLNLGISGTAAANNRPAALTRRLALLQAAGVTHILCDYGNNDLAGGRSVAQIQADLQAIWSGLDALGFKVVQCTLAPRTASAAFPVQSLTASGTAVTAQCAGHGFANGALIAISGASPSQYNGSFAVTVIDANSFSYTAASAPAVSPATGAILASDRWRTLANQSVYATNGGFVGGGASRRAQVNAWIRTKPAPLWDWFELADPIESARDSGLFAVNPAWADPSFTGDGIHPNVTNVAPETGGHFVLRNAFIPKLEAWLAM